MQALHRVIVLVTNAAGALLAQNTRTHATPAQCSVNYASLPDFVVFQFTHSVVCECFYRVVDSVVLNQRELWAPMPLMGNCDLFVYNTYYDQYGVTFFLRQLE